MKYEVLKSIWFNKIGIVQIQTKYNGVKYYIGEGKGINQNEDEQHIAKLGKPVSQKMIVDFFFKKEEQWNKQQ
jgi:hypothetical protein